MSLPVKCDSLRCGKRSASDSEVNRACHAVTLYDVGGTNNWFIRNARFLTVNHTPRAHISPLNAHSLEPRQQPESNTGCPARECGEWAPHAAKRRGTWKGNVRVRHRAFGPADSRRGDCGAGRISRRREPTRGRCANLGSIDRERPSATRHLCRDAGFACDGAARPLLSRAASQAVPRPTYLVA